MDKNYIHSSSKGVLTALMILEERIEANAVTFPFFEDIQIYIRDKNGLILDCQGDDLEQNNEQAFIFAWIDAVLNKKKPDKNCQNLILALYGRDTLELQKTIIMYDAWVKIASML